MAEKVTTVIAFVVMCGGFLVLLALVPVVDAVGASCRSRAAERRALWEVRAVAARNAVIARGRPSRTA